MPSRALHGSTCLIDRNRNYVYVGDRLASMLGWSARDLVGENALEFVEADTARPARVEAIDAGATVTDFATFITRDGARIPCSFTAQAVNGGELYLATSAPLMPVTLEPAAGLDGWLTRDEASRYARCSVRTLERAVHDGRLMAGGSSHRRLYRRAWLDAWIALALLVILTLVACCILDVVPCPLERVPLGHGGPTLHRELTHTALERRELRREAELDHRERGA
jgi:PAS domain S-box-containing protein